MSEGGLGRTLRLDQGDGGGMDTVSPQKRSETMRAVRSVKTAPERALLGALRSAGLPASDGSKMAEIGRPDALFKRARLAVFVDGCFWHGCPEHGRMPSSNQEYWRGKIERNRERDEEVGQALLARGWMGLRFWEHELKGAGLSACVERVRSALEARDWG